MIDRIASAVYPVVEIFHSIQGEGSWLGRPVTFIRLAGCNLRCPWCDTGWDKYTIMNVKEICEKVDQYDVVITGGEPLIHDILPLLFGLKDTLGCCRSIAIETNGTMPTSRLFSQLTWIVASPKPETGYKLCPECIAHELKFVVDDQFSIKQIDPEIRKQYKGRMWLQPEGSEMQKQWQKCFDIAMKHPEFKVGVQLHKIMNVQ